MRPSLRSDSLMSVSFDWWSPLTGMHVGWIWVKHGFAIAAPRLYARQIAVTFEPFASVDAHEVQHLGARVHLHLAEADLPLEGLVRAEEELLARLAAGVERPRDLRAAERAVDELAPVLARERNALRDALVDDRDADLGQAVDVRLAGTVIAALHRVVEEAPDAVAVVRVILRRVDAALGRDAVRAPRAVLEAEALHVVAELGERRRGRRAGEPAADDEDRVLPLVRGIDELVLEPSAVPFLLDGAVRHGGFQFERHVTSPAQMASGIEMYPSVITTAKIAAPRLSTGVHLGWLMPIDWNMLQPPWKRCMPSRTIATMYATDAHHTLKPVIMLWCTCRCTNSR